MAKRKRQEVPVTEPASPEHPSFDHFIEMGGQRIACFKVGGYERPPLEVYDAVRSINEALASISGDISLVRQWDGNVVFYEPSSRLVNPEVTDAMCQEFIDATLKANPGWMVVAHWRNAMHGVHGVSVRIAPKETND
jgi:hypothetical protein